MTIYPQSDHFVTEWAPRFRGSSRSVTRGLGVDVPVIPSHSGARSAGSYRVIQRLIHLLTQAHSHVNQWSWHWYSAAHSQCSTATFAREYLCAATPIQAHDYSWFIGSRSFATLIHWLFISHIRAHDHSAGDSFTHRSESLERRFATLSSLSLFIHSSFSRDRFIWFSHTHTHTHSLTLILAPFSRYIHCEWEWLCVWKKPLPRGSSGVVQ